MKRQYLKRTLICSLLVTCMVVPYIYQNQVNASKDRTLEEMITDSFVIINDDGTSRIVPLEQVSGDQEDEVVVSDRYNVIHSIGGEIVDTYDSKQEAQAAALTLEEDEGDGEYAIEPYNTEAVSVGVVYIKTSDVTEYTNTKTKMTGYISGAYGTDAAYIGTFDGKIRAKIAGVVADFDPDDVNVEAYSSASDVSYYIVEDGYLRHYYIYGSTHEVAATRVGYALDYLKANQVYYSYDGHYFYTDYSTMVADYQNDSYAQAVNPDEPYYNYYQFLSHRTTSQLSGTDFDQITMGTIGKTSYETSKFYEIGSEFVKYQDQYTVNAMLMFGVAANESNWGRSSIAQDKNNLFGHGANDSNPYYGANGYTEPGRSVEDHAWHFVSRTYMDYEDWRYYGPHLGDKEGGLNVKYASDPYWGEKAASRSYYLDEKSVDDGMYTIGIIDGILTNYPLYQEPSESATVVFSASYLSNLPVLIIDEVTKNGQKWYKILSDTSLNEDRTAPDYSLVYDASHDYLYVPADTVTIVWEGKEQIEEPEPTYVLGDVNGDGVITPADYIKVKNHILGKSTLTGDALKAADMNGDGAITPADYVKIKNRILNG